MDDQAVGPPPPRPFDQQVTPANSMTLVRNGIVNRHHQWQVTAECEQEPRFERGRLDMGDLRFPPSRISDGAQCGAMTRRHTFRKLDDLDSRLSGATEGRFAFGVVMPKLVRMLTTHQANVVSSVRETDSEACGVLQEPVAQQHHAQRFCFAWRCCPLCQAGC
jgi:hypothetical protein